MKALITFALTCICTIAGYLIYCSSNIDSDFKFMFEMIILTTWIGIIGGMYNLDTNQNENR